MAARLPGRPVTSVFFGGGTPSLMRPANRRRDPRRRSRGPGASIAGAEITLEANPTSVEAERFRGFRAAGVNRVSLGVQALNDADLRRLGRMHSRGGGPGGGPGRRRLLRALLLRPHLRAPRPERRGLAGGADGGDRARGRAPLALPAHHRARHLVRAPAPRRQARRPGRRGGAGPLRDHPGGLRRARPAGLRDLEPCPPGGGIPAQPRLLALRRICRRRPRRAWAPRRRQRPPRDRDREASRDLARARRAGRPRHRRGGGPHGQPRRATSSCSWACGCARASTRPAIERLSGRALDEGRIRDLEGYGFLARRPDQRLAVTRAGFPVLDAVVADLAA